MIVKFHELLSHFRYYRNQDPLQLSASVLLPAGRISRDTAADLPRDGDDAVVAVAVIKVWDEVGWKSHNVE